LFGVNAVHRAGLHAQFILGTGVGNYVCHMFGRLQLRGHSLYSRKEEVKLDIVFGMGGPFHALSAGVGLLTRKSYSSRDED
jgi:hypothetical protein